MTKPQINSVQIVPNPVNTNSAYKILVDVEEIEVIFSTAYYYAKSDGEIITGEEVGIL